jgi:hypothetical protein
LRKEGDTIERQALEWNLLGHAEGEGLEVPGRGVFSMRLDTVARHGKKFRHWLKTL